MVLAVKAHITSVYNTHTVLTVKAHITSVYNNTHMVLAV